jgi:hypothetical protein
LSLKKLINDAMKSLVTKDNFLNSLEQKVELSYAPLIIEIWSTKLMVVARRVWGVPEEQKFVGSGVLTAVAMNIFIFWDIMPINRRF